MSRWAQSLIKLSNYEVETLQKRLTEIADARRQVEMRLAVLHAEGQAEQAAAAGDPSLGWRIVGYMEALKVRMDAVRQDLYMLQTEEQGARDALGRAFETQKKYEQVAEKQQIVAAKKAGQFEAAQMDELGLRKVAAR